MSCSFRENDIKNNRKYHLIVIVFKSNEKEDKRIKNDSSIEEFAETISDEENASDEIDIIPSNLSNLNIFCYYVILNIVIIKFLNILLYLNKCLFSQIWIRVST